MSDQTAPNTAEVASEKPETQEVVVESDSAEKNADSGVDDASSSQRGRQERRRNGRANRGRGGPQQQQTAPRQAQYPQHQQAYGQQPYRNYFPQGVPRGAQPQFRPQFNGQRYQYVQDPRGAGPHLYPRPNQPFPMHGRRPGAGSETSSVSGENLSQNNIYIRGLPATATDETLDAMCKGFGTITSCKAIIDNQTQQCKGFGF
eukprot:Colp12_sorted_trinity150504_noHs@4660